MLFLLDPKQRENDKERSGEGEEGGEEEIMPVASNSALARLVLASINAYINHTCMSCPCCIFYFSLQQPQIYLSREWPSSFSQRRRMDSGWSDSVVMSGAGLGGQGASPSSASPTSQPHPGHSSPVVSRRPHLFPRSLTYSALLLVHLFSNLHQNIPARWHKSSVLPQ